MDAAEFVRDITFKMCDRDFDLELVASAFSDDFAHHANGAKSDKAGYLARGREYRDRYASIDRPDFEELFAVDDRVVVAYTLQLHLKDGSAERMAVMAIWTVADGKVTALREVDAPAAEPSRAPSRSGRAPPSSGAALREPARRMKPEQLSRDGLPYLLFTPPSASEARPAPPMAADVRRGPKDRLTPSYEAEPWRRPLILFLHGSGERGDSTATLARLTVHSLPGLALADLLPARVAGEPFPFLVACPQTTSGRWHDERRRLVALLEELVEARGADRERVYLTGISMGAIGCWELAAAAPGRFAVLAPVSWRVPALTDRLGDTPVWCFVGARDPYFTADEVERELYARRGRDALTRLEVDPEGGHDGEYWDRVYGRAELYAWMLAHATARRR